MILSCQGISQILWGKGDPGGCLFSHKKEREKAALIGNNGAGKTTLLRIIMEEISRGFRSGGHCQGQEDRLSGPVPGCPGSPHRLRRTDDHQAVHLGYGGQASVLMEQEMKYASRRQNLRA